MNCFVCDKDITYTIFKIDTDAYSNIKELRIINEHYGCKKLYDRKILLLEKVRSKNEQINKLEKDLLNVEWKLFKLKDLGEKN